MSDLSGIQKIIYSDDTTNTSMDQRAERKDPSLAIDTVDRAVRVMLDNERNEDGYKYEESYIYNLNADDIGPGLGWECLRLERAVVEDETGYVPTVNVYLVSADGKTEELVHGTEKGSAEWVYDKEKIEKFAKDCCTKDGGRGFVSTIDLGLTNPKVDVPPKPVVTTVDADNFMNLLEEKGISEAFYDITEEQGVYAELDSGFVPFEYRDQYRDIVESIREFDPCYGYIAGHDTTRTDNVEVKELTSPNEIQDFIKDFVGENPDLYDIDHVKIYIQSSDALTDGEIEGSYVPYIETEGIRLNGEQPEKLSIPVSNLVTIECHEKDAPANVVSRATTIMDGFGRTWNPEGNYSRLNIHNQDFGISSRLTMAAGRSNYLKEADQVLDMCGKEERDRIADQKEVKEELLNEKVFVMDSVSFFLSVGVDGNSPQRVYAQRVQDLKDNRTEIENQYLRTMTAKAYVSAKILPVHDAILEKVKTLRSEASKPKKEQDFEKVKKLERMIVQDVREYKGIYERYGVQALALHASNLEKAYDKNDPFLDESRYKETYETQTRWIKEFGPEEDTEVDKDLDARIGAFIGSSGVRGQLPAIESRELPDYSNSEIEHTIRSILEEIRDESNEKYSDLEGHKLITAISDRTGTLTIRTEGMVEGYPVLPPFARPDIIDKIKTERYYPITFQSDDQHDFIDNAILLRDDENKDKNLDLLTLAVRKIGADVGKMDHGENHHLFDIIKGNMLSQTFEKTLLINVINDIDKKKDGNEKIRVEKIFKDALSKTKEDVAKEENEEKKVDVSEEQREDNSPDEVTDEKSFYKVQTSPYAKIDPKQEVAISKEKQEELKKEAETEAKKDERVVEDPDKYDEVFKEKYDQKTEALKEKLTALKDEILHYNKQLSTYEDIPFKYRGQHAFYHAAKYEHDKAAYEYEKIGGAVGTGQFLSEKMSTLKMYCSLSDLCNCDYAKTLFLNILRGKPEQTISDIYKKEDGSNYKGRSHLEELGPDYHMTESALKTEIAAELVKRNIPYKNKEIKCHGFRISAERNYFENKECEKKLVQKIKNETSDSYKQNRYSAIANVFHIFCTSNMRTLLCLENILAEEGKEKWDTTVLNKLLELAKKDTDYRGDDIEIIVMNSKNFKNKKKEFKEKLNKHKRVIIISSYKTLAEGQNLQYNVKDTDGLIRLPGKRKDKEKDLDGIYLGEITYIIRRSIDSGQPFDRNERNKNISEQIFQAEDLFVHSEIGKTDKEEWIKEAFLGENKSKQYNLKSVGVSITRTVLQAVGRLCRTTLKSPDIYILVNENVLKKMNVDDLNIKESQCLFPPEMLKILELKEEYNRDKERAKEDSIKEAWEEAREEANKSSFRSLDWINDFLENCWKLIEQRNWIEMREWVLKYPTLYDEAKLPDNILNEFYFHIPGRKKKYYFKAYNDFQDGVEVSFADKSNCRGWSEMSEKAAKLPYILKYKGMKEYFKKKGYVTSFKMLPRILNPVMFRNIYKGALGEVAGRFIIENELGIKLIDITEPEKFEKFDFRLNEEVYVDFKNWDESMQVDRENELKKIRQKMRMVGAKRVYIINIVVEDGTKYEIKESTDGIIEIPGLITKNGDIITKPIEKLAKEVK